MHHATADGELFTSLDEFVRDNERMYYQMRSYASKLVWATIIPAGKVLDEKVKVNALINSAESGPAPIYLAHRKKNGTKMFVDTMKQHAKCTKVTE